MGVLIDTSWLIEVERVLTGNPQVAQRLPVNVLVSAVSIAELRLGVELSDDRHRESRRQFVDLLLREATIVPFGQEEAIAYAAVAAHLRRTGQRIGERDLLIAATALANGHSVVTLNRGEFERVPGLVVETGPDLTSR
jgi:tRNA(fMet)-specific endonuclease VapC